MDGGPWGVDAAAATAELRRTVESMAELLPTRVGEGRMTKAAADRQLAIFREILSDLAIAFGPIPWILPNPCFTWREKSDVLGNELATRRRFYPDRVDQGRMTAADAAAQLAGLEAVHTLYWRKGFGFTAPAGQSMMDAVREHVAELERRDREAEPVGPETQERLAI